MSAESATNSSYTLLLPQRLTPLEKCPSPFSGSLAILSDKRGECSGYAIACGSHVILTRVKGDREDGEHTILEPFSMGSSNGVIDGLALVTGVKWCSLTSGQTVLVVTSFAGFIIYNVDGSKRLFQYRTTHNDQSTTASCMKGIAPSVCDGICIGSSDGHILVFSLVPDKGVEFKRQLEGHVAPVTCLCSSNDGNKLASGDESGSILVWKNPVKNGGHTTLYKEHSSNPFQCVCLCWYKNDIVIGCYGNGLMRIFSVKMEVLLIEVAAHCRLISTVDIAQDSGLVLTASEDSTLSVWQLDNSGKTSKVSLVHNRLIENSLITGGVMCDSVGSMFAVVGYGFNTIQEYSRS